MTNRTPLLLAIVGGLAACRTITPEPDVAALDAVGSLRSTIWVGKSADRDISGFASAVVLDSRRLLTAAHVWATAEPWYGQPLPTKGRLALLWSDIDAAGAGIAPPSPREPWLHVEFRLVAASANTPGRNGDISQHDYEDWAIVECDAPLFPMAIAATKHADHPVASGARLVIAGFSMDFAYGGSRHPKAPAPSASPFSFAQLEGFLTGGPHAIPGTALAIDGKFAVSCRGDSPPPTGHSGGGVYAWNERLQRAELVGVFHTAVRSKAVTTTAYGLLGSSVGSDQSEVEARWALVYSPLACIPW